MRLPTMTLGSRLLLAIAPIVVGALLGLGYAVYAQMKGAASADLEHRMLQVLEQSEREWQNLVGTLHANTELFASSHLMERYALTDDEGERVDLLQPALLRLFSAYQRAYPNYTEIRFLLPDGYEDTRLTTGAIDNFTDEEGARPWFKRMVRSTDATDRYLEFGWNPDDGSPVLEAGRAIRLTSRNRSSATPTELRGYVTVAASMEDYADSISRQIVGRTGSLVLLDASGNAVGTASAESSQALRRALAARPIDEHGAAQSLRVGAEHVLVRSARLPGGLAVHVVLSEAEFAAARISLATTIATIAALAIAALTALLFYVMRKVLLEPLERLGGAARAIGEGDEDVVLDIARGDEIGRLASEFRRMQRKLGTSMNELKDSHDRIELLAFTDSLTGLPNRRAFLSLVDAQLGDAATTPDRAALLFLDLDGFKRVNDTLGHEAGDRLLVAIAGRLQKLVERRQEGALVARLGGDEFTLWLPGESRDGAVSLAMRVVAALRVPVSLGSRDVVVGTSVGVSLYPHMQRDGTQLLKCADVAMYDAKRAGPNNWRLYGHAMQAGLERRMELENELYKALEQRSLSIDYQPQYDPLTGSLTGCEALLRWRHPELGVISPADFVPLAEANGLIGPIGAWVLDEACRQWSVWQLAGIAPPRIAVNVSQRQFTSYDIAQLVETTLARHGVDAHVLEVELTESCMMQAESSVVDALDRLRARGVRVAMDDFGTGYSSLAALTQLPIDTLKIDRSFVTGIRTDSANAKVVSAILLLARGLDLEIVAEGVETPQELAFLREHDCDIVQGFLLSRPLPADAMTLLLNEQYPRAAAA